MTWDTAAAVVGSLDVNSGPYTLVRDTETLGSAQAIIGEIASNLQDGSLVRRTRFGNRSEVQLTVMIEGTTSLELAQYSKALVLACNEAKTLTLSSYDGVAPAAVFDVHVVEYQTVNLSGIAFQTLEANFIRGYLLTFTCQPFVRSATQVTVPALATTGGTPTVIADGTSTTGWSGGSISVLGGNLRTTYIGTFNPPAGGGDIWGQTWETGVVTRTLTSTDMTTTPFITVDVKNSFQSATTPTYYSLMGATGYLTVNGQTASLVASYTKPGDANYQRLVFVIPGAVIAAVTTLAFRFGGSFSIHKNAGMPSLAEFDNVTRTSVPPSPSSAGTGVSLFNVPGSERTPASLTVQGGAGGNGLDLGDVALYTSPTLGENGYTPDMRQWSASSTSSNNPFVAHVPAILLPRGTYLLAATIAATTGSYSIPNWTVQSEDSANTAFGLAQSRSSVATIPTGTGVGFAPLGMVSLPPTAGANIVDDKVNISLPAVVGVAWQNVYVFHLGDPVTGSDDGAVSWARTTSGGKLLTLNSPDLSNDGEPEMFWSIANGTNQRWAGDDGKLSIHSMIPPQTLVWFLATGAATRVGIAGALFPRFDAWPDQ